MKKREYSFCIDLFCLSKNNRLLRVKISGTEVRVERKHDIKELLGFRIVFEGNDMELDVQKKGNRNRVETQTNAMPFFFCLVLWAETEAEGEAESEQPEFEAYSV